MPSLHSYFSYSSGFWSEPDPGLEVEPGSDIELQVDKVEDDGAAVELEVDKVEDDGAADELEVDKVEDDGAADDTEAASMSQAQLVAPFRLRVQH